MRRQRAFTRAKLTQQQRGGGPPVVLVPRDHSEGPPVRGPEQPPTRGSELRHMLLKRGGIALLATLFVYFIYVAVFDDPNASSSPEVSATTEAHVATVQADRWPLAAHCLLDLWSEVNDVSGPCRIDPSPGHGLQGLDQQWAFPN